MALLVREGLTYRDRPDLGTFNGGVFESVFVEIVRGGGRRNDIVGAVYRPPGGDLRASQKTPSLLYKAYNRPSGSPTHTMNYDHTPGLISITL